PSAAGPLATAGSSRCSTQTTPQAQACIQGDGPPRISAAALLALAAWCRARRGDSLGGPSCPTPTAPPFPPAPEARTTSRPPEPTSGGPPPGAAPGSSAGAQPDYRAEPPARRAEGGRP